MLKRNNIIYFIAFIILSTTTIWCSGCSQEQVNKEPLCIRILQSTQYQYVHIPKEAHNIIPLDDYWFTFWLGGDKMLGKINLLTHGYYIITFTKTGEIDVK